ncbi:hypothetical protein ACQJBY_015157 [Aegilops geniculata]
MPQKSRCKLFTEPPKPKDTALPDSTTKMAPQAEEDASAGNDTQAASIANVGQETRAASAEDSKNAPADRTKAKSGSEEALNLDVVGRRRGGAGASQVGSSAGGRWRLPISHGSCTPLPSPPRLSRRFEGND